MWRIINSNEVYNWIDMVRNILRYEYNFVIWFNSPHHLYRFYLMFLKPGDGILNSTGIVTWHQIFKQWRISFSVQFYKCRVNLLKKVEKNILKSNNKNLLN